jgi:predicted transglutaminase-like protease
MTKMNIKQRLSRIYFVLYCFFQGYCPTQGEIKNSHVKRLASRLKAGSYEETLTNIVEWQDRNIKFWTERHPIYTLLTYIYGRILLAFILLAFCGPIIIIGILVVLNIQTIVVTWLIQIVVWFILNILWFIAILASITITIIATMILILHSNRKIPWEEVPRGLKNIFVPSISIEFLLKNKLGVCRDYAKLTACLLSNIYPNEQIYFATAPSHVATGIMIKGNLYMLDQRLPILTMDKWRNYRNARAKDKVEKFTKRSLKRRVLKKIDIFCLPSTTGTTSFDTKELAKRMTKLLDIRGQTGVDASLLETQIPLKRGATLYEDNEMVNYSLARFLRMQISKALISPSQITRIEVVRHDGDLIFLIRFSLE